ncbi:ComEC/Rec2 family competence protein, partial [Candidatus Saccharibacteria bacterium]|nr:ComEC/Rec2 family competence protein [Candidatus Saccharibacteria bacterium]
MMMQLKYKRTTIVIAGCIAILLGLYLAKLTTPISFSWIILAIISLVILWRHKTARLLLVIILFFGFGWWRGGLLQVDNQKYSEYYGKKVSVIATAQEDGFYAQNSQLEFTANNVSINGESLPGKIKIKGYGEPAVYRYDKVEAVGKIYPSIGGRQANISYADISVIATTNSKLDDLRRNFIVGMETALPEPAASFGIGLLVGQRSLLPADVLATLTAVGLVHIIAVSGYNLTIIIDFIRRISARLSRFQVVFLASGLMYAFI